MLLGEFEPFCRRYQGGMFLVAKSVLHNDMAAEDAVQIALTRIFKLFGKLEFELEKQEKAYALRAAQNVAIDLLKQERQDEEFSEETVEHCAVRCGDSTFQSMAACEMSDDLLDAIERLPQKAQAIFKYREYGLKDVEIADTLGISVSDVRTTAFRARQAVAKHLKERGLCCE